MDLEASARAKEPVQAGRLLLCLAVALASCILLTPLAGALGAAPRKAAQFSLQLGFLLALAATARSKGGLLSDSGLGGEARPLRLWVTGFLVGIATLAAYSALLLALGERSMEPGPSGLDLLAAALKYVPLAFLIGIIEDVLFFGFLYAVFGKRLSPCVAIYAVTHFLDIGKQAAFSDERWRHGLEALGFMQDALAGVVHRPIELIGLCVVGLVLGILRHVSGSVWLSMGVHGGWYWVRTVGRRVSEDLGGPGDWVYGTDRFYDGVLGWCVLLLTGGLLARFVARRRG